MQRKKLYETIDSYISIIVDESQFYSQSDDDIFDDGLINDSIEFRRFKKDKRKQKRFK